MARLIRTIVQIAVHVASIAFQSRTQGTMLKLAGALLAIGAFVACSGAVAQTANDDVDPAHKNPLRVRDIANRPCVTVKGRMLIDKINTNIITHYLRAANSCPKVIKIKACYTQSTRCVEFTLHSLEKKEVLLGITNSSMPTLNFDFTEKEM
ncbi:hypothetical protein [Rhodoplanes sp. Z2-YC6860]|uniref:hypothetical protein n=1 Tax=Rhodoplanes sp. Z2-YC6860 TaxID=674703 RepID=UPI00078C4D79|nr:hypothetical protein [Rhodoplanes sp. Z2-YC6860]AMN43621.1 hypothetical protein RHPLAN_51980 [Rhodoplanes sp. Z2-YC6860]